MKHHVENGGFFFGFHKSESSKMHVFKRDGDGYYVADAWELEIAKEQIVFIKKIECPTLNETLELIKNNTKKHKNER